MINYYGKELNAYKASLHTHSTTSDGKFTPAEIIEQYRNRGYDFLVFTDHGKTNPVSTYDGKGMTLISGMEIHPKGPRGIRWHIVAVNVPEDFVFEDIDAQDMIDKAVNAGAYCICAHPYWCGIRSDEIAPMKNFSAIEVYNTSTRYIGRAYNMTIWDELSDRGIVYPAVAVDDAHGPADLFHGWTVICAPDTSHESFMNALKSGSFYATQGPEFTRIAYENGVFEAEFSPCTEVVALTNPSVGYCVTVPDWGGPDTGANPVTSCKIQPKPAPFDRWFRLQIKDADGKYAWTNPIIVPATKE